MIHPGWRHKLDEEFKTQDSELTNRIGLRRNQCANLLIWFWPELRWQLSEPSSVLDKHSFCPCELFPTGLCLSDAGMTWQVNAPKRCLK